MTPKVRPAIDLTRSVILAYRRRVQALDERLPAGPDSLRRAAAVGLQDSVPRSALHSLHARTDAVAPDAWADPSLVQVWGPRYTAYLVPAGEHVAFTLGRLPQKGRIRERAEDLAARLRDLLGGRRMRVDEAGAALGVPSNSLRYASLTGSVLIRWDGARQPTLWTVPRAGMSPAGALEGLVRRYLHWVGPAAVDSFVRWAGVDARAAAAAFDALASSLLPVRTPLGEAHLLAEDEPLLHEPLRPPAPARLLPSGDPYYLLWGGDRALLVPDATRRDALWTSRVWPGALLVRGEVAGTWRRTKEVVDVRTWRPLSSAEREAVEKEAAALPLPDVGAEGRVRWANQ